ncbi:hypothetical protein AAIM60_01595 [Pseudomonas lijiangensis]|uniref:hypothetical protein n=1 Tax=Pseudomonas lijiangensis TaxID=2995658 RepID=UPI0031B9B611
MNLNDRTLVLQLASGDSITVEVTGYHLKLLDKLHTDTQGKVYKLGTFKITSQHYKQWADINKIKYPIGECAVLKDKPTKETPRTITFKVRHDFN